ncbi:hypothetical protein LTR37_018128 [Vermiconidia calcicola]|uniref:Uncharacterized protein n=1 Tax=Vermiconidia calcicola TaxID=1690605 RepID=A0ACC3MI07_9PEZI|nr:hypothetical protein LTR37_018128 [Vermiconidia calcicola]
MPLGPPDAADAGRHSVSPNNTGRLTPLYNGKRRGSNSVLEESPPQKKLTLKLKKQHKKVTSPAWVPTDRERSVSPEEPDQRPLRHLWDRKSRAPVLMPPQVKGLLEAVEDGEIAVDEVAMGDALDLSPEEMEAQKKALEGFEKSQRQKVENEAIHDNCAITGFNLADSSRSLDYEVLYHSSGIRQWFPALDLQGDQWTEKMESFWLFPDSMEKVRELMENAHGRDFVDPGPFARQIVRAALAYEREFIFDTRIYEHYTGDEDC